MHRRDFFAGIHSKLSIFFTSQIKNHVKDDYNKMKEDLAKEIKEAIGFAKIAICLDLWQDKLRKIHYLRATCHYLTRGKDTKKLMLQSRILDLVPLDAELPKSADLLHEIVVEILITYGIEDDVDQNVVFVTDRGANIMNTVDGYQHHSCMNHLINNVVKAALEPIKEVKKNVNPESGSV